MGDLLKEFYSQQAASKAVQPCRHKPTLIFKIGETEIWGASEMHVDQAAAEGFTLVVNLTGRRRFTPQTGFLKSTPKRFAFLKKLSAKPPVEELVIAWKDYGILPADRTWWEAFAAAVAQEKKVLFFCVGGHGRTGTALGCLMTVALGIHGGQAIRDVRKYCKEAIETKEQEQYVRSMTVKKQ